MDVSIDEIASTVQVVDTDALLDRATIERLTAAVLERIADARTNAAVRRLDDDDSDFELEI